MLEAMLKLTTHFASTVQGSSIMNAIGVHSWQVSHQACRLRPMC